MATRYSCDKGGRHLYARIHFLGFTRKEFIQTCKRDGFARRGKIDGNGIEWTYYDEVPASEWNRPLVEVVNSIQKTDNPKIKNIDTQSGEIK